MVADRVVAEEEEQPVTKDRSAYCSAELVEACIIALRIVVGLEALIRVQAGAVQLEKPGAMELIGAVLRDQLDLRAAEASTFCVVGICDNLHLFDGVGIRCDHRSRSPRHAGRLNSVYGDAVAVAAAAIPRDLRSVFGLIRATTCADASRPLIARQSG